MTTCDVCGAALEAPRECPYCGNQLCSDHRLPESHDCSGVDAAADDSWFDSAFDEG